MAKAVKAKCIVYIHLKWHVPYMYNVLHIIQTYNIFHHLNTHSHHLSAAAASPMEWMQVLKLNYRQWTEYTAHRSDGSVIYIKKDEKWQIRRVMNL